MSLSVDEYDDRIKNEFKSNKIVNLWLTLGLKKKGFELRTRGCSYTFDLFLNYKINETNQCSYYHTSNKLFR